jgi:transketolase
LGIGSLVNKFEAFDWEVKEIDGHNHSQIISVLRGFRSNNNLRPLCIVANTVKGKGLTRMENNPEWHHKSPNASELEELLRELGE